MVLYVPAIQHKASGVDKANMRVWLEGEEGKDTKIFKKTKLI